MTDAAPLVVCLLGTDHHPFTRLVGWCDALAARRPDLEVLVQHGHSPAPATANGQAFLAKDELSAAVARAQVAITHGGPGLISDVRAAGLVPLVVARDPGRGEHVDGHQQRFVARVSAAGLVRALDTEDAFNAEVEQALESPRGSLIDHAADARRLAASVDRFAALVEPLMRRAR